MNRGGQPAALLLAASLCSLGCGGARNNGTGLRLFINSDLIAPQIDSIKVEVSTTGDHKDHRFTVNQGTTFPLELGVAPAGEPGFGGTIVATALLGSTEVGRHAVMFTFEPGMVKPIALHIRAGGSGGDGGAPLDGPGATDGPGPPDGLGLPDALPDQGGVSSPWMAEVTPEIPSGATLNRLWPIGEKDVWVVGSLGARGVAYHFDGLAWAASMLPANTPGLYGVWATGSDDVWAVGFSGVVLRRRGGEWQRQQSLTDEVLTGVWGSGPRSVWVVGRSGTVLRWDGTSWASSVAGVSGGSDLVSVAGSSEDDVWAVGTQGTIYRLRLGASADFQNHGLTQNPFFDVWAGSPENVWAVGEGVTLRFNGRQWAIVPGTPSSALGVWGSGPDDVWAVGGTGGAQAIAHFDGSAWSPVLAPSANVLQSVRGLSADRVWAVGNMGTVLRLVRR